MRTYSRKRPEHHEIDGVHGLCRLCLGKCLEGESAPIFTDKSGNVCASLALRIMICVGLEMTQDDCLPNLVCSSCLNELEKYYAFRKKCEASYQKLKSHAMAVQMKEYKKELEMQEKNSKSNMMKNEKTEAMKHDLIFMVNLDGTVQMCGEIPPLSKERVFIDYTKETSMESSLKIGQAIQNNECTDESTSQAVSKLVDEVANDEKQCIESSDRNKFSNKEENSDSLEENTSQVVENYEDLQSCSIQFKPEHNDEELSNFLTEVLVQMGIVVRGEEGIAVVDEGTRVEIETGDCVDVVMEVVEEAEEEEQEEQPDDNRKTSIVFREENILAVLKDSAKAEEKKSSTKDKKNEDTAPRSRLCSECGRVFSCASAARRHWRAAHRRMRPHVCPQCGRAFAQKEVCARHQLLHEEQRPYACERCGKSFTQRGALAAHERGHQPPQHRPLQLHQCPVCQKVFLHASGLSRHSGVHMGRQYSCGGCSRRFTDCSALKRHRDSTRHPAASTAMPTRFTSVDTSEKKLNTPQKEKTTPIPTK